MREMKDSGVAWIGEIPETWETMPVKNVFEITRGRVIAKTEIEEEARENYYPVYSSQTANNGVLGYIQTFDYSVDSLTWTTDGAKAGTVFLRRGKYSITNVCGILTPKTSEQCLEFLHYTVSYSAFNCRRADINGYKIMSNEMAIIPIVLPPISTQQKIAAHLDRKCTQIDALISNAQQQIEKLKAYKQSVITETVTKGLDPDVKMKDSGVEYLGKIPMNWGVISIGIAFRYVGGYAFKSELFCGETNNQVLRIGNIKNDNLILEEKQVFVKDDYAEQAKNCEVIENDILFSMTGTKGKKDYFYTLLVSSDNLKNRRLFINQRVGIFRKKVPNVNMRYYNYVLKEHSILNYIFLSETGTANQGNLGIENISRTKMYFPTLDEQQQIADYLDHKCSQIDKLIALKQQKIEKLQQYKKSLIYEYVTGKKEV